MKIALQIVGVAALLIGLLWIGQGTGLIHWPPSSFMVAQRPWVLRGALLAAVGPGASCSREGDDGINAGALSRGSCVGASVKA